MFSTLFWNLKFGSGLGHRVTLYIGGISRLPVAEMCWGKKSKKKPGILNNFCFLFNFKISNIDWPYDTNSLLWIACSFYIFLDGIRWMDWQSWVLSCYCDWIYSRILVVGSWKILTHWNLCWKPSVHNHHKLRSFHCILYELNLDLIWAKSLIGLVQISFFSSSELKLLILINR